MKHLPTLLLALGLSAAAATAQNVTVMMKDGTTHKFNADRLSELKFLDVPQEQRMDVTFLQPEITEYSGGYASLTFTDAEGSVEFNADIYGPAEAVWFYPGTYRLQADGTPYTIDPEYTTLKINGESKTIADAVMTVSYGPQTTDSRRREQTEDPERIYSIETTVTTADGIKLVGKYTGLLANYTRWLTLALDKAGYNVNEQLPGDFYVKFSDPDYKCELAIVFSADASATTLPAGTYILSDVRMPGTISNASYVDVYRPNANLKLAPGSKVTVTRDGDNYSMDMALNLSDGRIGEFTYSGTISGTPKFINPQPDGTHFTAVSEEVYGSGNVTLTFTTEDDQSLELDMWGSETAVCLEPGEYIIGAETGLYVDPGYSEYRFTPEGADAEDTKELKSGKVTVTDADGVYTILFDITFEDDSTLKGWFEGELPKYGSLMRGTLTKAEYNDVVARPAGNMYIKFNDPDWVYTVGLNMFADPAAKLLPAGTYTYGDRSTEPGTFDWNSYVDIYTGGSTTNNRMAEGSTVTVEEAEGAYTITMDMKFTSGRRAVLTYNGTISGKPSFETVEPEGTHFTGVSENVCGSGNVEITFTAGDQESLKLDMYGSTNAVCLEPGEYIVGAEDGMHIDPYYCEYSYADAGGVMQTIKPKEGKVTVTEAEGVYTILIDITLEDDRTLKGWFEGELPNYGTLMRGTLNKAEYNDAVARPAGNIYVKFTTTNWVYTVGLNMFADPEATVLPAGTYTYGDRSSEAGTFDWNSYVDIYAGGSSTNNRMVEGSTVTVEESEGVYTITMDMKFTSGRRAVLTYNGTISGAPVFE